MRTFLLLRLGKRDRVAAVPFAFGGAGLVTRMCTSRWTRSRAMQLGEVALGTRRNDATRPLPGQTQEMPLGTLGQ
jgi:hypothetical protein